MSDAAHYPPSRAAIDAAARQTGQNQLVIVMGDMASSIGVKGPPGAVFVDASSHDFFDRLEREGLCDPARSQEILSLALGAMTRGVELRAEGKFAAAYMHQRWVLFVAVRFDQRPGIHATTANVWVIRQAIRNVTIRALGPARNASATEDEIAAMAAYEESVRWAEGAIESDAAILAPQVRADIGERTQGESAAPDWLAVHRLARMGGGEALRGEALAKLKAFAAEGAAAELVLAAIEEVAELDITGVLRAVGLIAPEENAPRPSGSFMRGFVPGSLRFQT
jgi:hypothetical protein